MHTRSNWDRPEFYEYTFDTHVNCDGCRAVLTVRSIGLDTEEAQAERRQAAREHATAQGWDCSSGEQCPACAPKLAEGTMPGTRPVVCRGGVNRCETHDCWTVASIFSPAPVCPIGGRPPEAER